MYKGIFYLLLVCLLSPMSGAAQYTGYERLENVAAFRSQFAAESSKVMSISSDFKQTKELIALTERITSYGKFWFKRSNLVRIDYEKPFVYRMVMNGEKIFIKDEQKQSTVNVRSNKLFQQVNRIMVDCIQGTILESKDFTSQVFDSRERYLLELTPASKALKEFFDKIILVVDKKTYAVDEIKMIESGGDYTLLTFTNKVLNQPIKDEVFAL